MDAMIRACISFFILFWGWAAPAQQMNWSELAGDTVYYAREYFPEGISISQPGVVQAWDFRSLRAPYAISRRITVTNERDNLIQAQLTNGNHVDAQLQIQGGAISLVQTQEENPICKEIPLTYQWTPAYKPFFRGVLADHTSYRGRKVASFAWPRHVSCSWTPSLLPDSCRITQTVTEEVVVDGEGTLYLPTQVSPANRQHVTLRKATKVEFRYVYGWRDVTNQVPGIRLITTQELLRFISTETGLMLAEIELKENQAPFRVEFKTHPIATRIFQEEPARPDIYAFPNPSFDIVRFQLSELPFGKYKLKIFNILGTPIREMDVNVDDLRTTVTMDLGDLQRGTYLYRLQDSNGRTIKTKRVVLIQA